jgi:transcriptional regulator with XRE-family HTH domain
MPAPARPRLGRPRAMEIDRHVGARLRERRLLLGMTQQQLAKSIGVTYQQTHKYENGVNRVASGRLQTIAQALGVKASYFFDGISAEADTFRPTAKQQLLLELGRNFIKIADRRQQEAICNLVRVLAGPDPERDESAPPVRGRSAIAV